MLQLFTSVDISNLQWQQDAGVPVCKMRYKIETKRNLHKRNKIYRNETKQNEIETKPSENDTKQNYQNVVVFFFFKSMYISLLLHAYMYLYEYFPCKNTTKKHAILHNHEIASVQCALSE